MADLIPSQKNLASSHHRLKRWTLVCLVLIASCFTSPVFSDTVTQLSQASFLDQSNKEADRLVLDVRSPQEFAAGHIPGAVNVPYTDIENQLEKLAPYQSKPIVIYCRSGRRAEIAAAILHKSNFLKLAHLEGDMLAWEASQLPIEK